jgi:hypothetical protein
MTFDIRLMCPQSPVAVWANANSFVFSPVNESPQCQMFGDSSVMGVYACQV